MRNGKSWFETEGPIELTAEEAEAFCDVIEKQLARPPLPIIIPPYKMLNREEIKKLFERWGINETKTE